MAMKVVKNMSRRPQDFLVTGEERHATLRPGEERQLNLRDPDSPANQGRVAVGVITMKDEGESPRKRKQEGAE